jgi:TPR repeat protein
VRDSQRYWRAGVPFYDPAQIVAPVLLIHGEWDRDTPSAMSQALLSKLKNAPWRRYVVIGEATHMLMMEKNRQQLFEEVQLFLEREEAPKPAEALQVASAIAEAAEQAETPQSAGSEGSTLAASGKSANREPAKDADMGEREGEQESAVPTKGSSHGSMEAATVSGETAALMARGQEFLALGDISAARLFYERAAESGSARAMTALGTTYDPDFLARIKAVGIRPDPALAAEWYRKAMAFDGTEAAFCSKRLRALAQQ